jgi:putative FmdB family regulatory protein
MPTYDYLCENEHRFELFHSIKDDSAKTCPECGASARRVPAGGSGLLFKGSGFYITDYRSKHYKERANAEKPGGSSAGGGSSSAGGSSPSGGSSSGGSSSPGGVSSSGGKG